MGTSGSSKGAGSGTPLVPTWLEHSPAGPLPGGDDPAKSEGSGDGEKSKTSPTSREEERTAIPAPPEARRFGGARGNFTSFASSAGTDRRALRRAVRDYVRSGTRGSANAVQRMGSSREAASRALGVFRGFQRDGVAETLVRLNLANLVGRPARDIFIGLTDIICKEGGPVDEAIARDAWLETCAEVERIGIDDLAALTPEQVKEVFQTFVVHAVETKLFQEIGVNGFKVADIAAIEAFEAGLRSYVDRAVRDSFTSDLTPLPSLSDDQIRSIVDKTYKDAWDLFVIWGDQEG